MASRRSTSSRALILSCGERTTGRETGGCAATPPPSVGLRPLSRAHTGQLQSPRSLQPYNPGCRTDYFGVPLDLGQFERYRRVMYSPFFKTLVGLSFWNILSNLEVAEGVWVARVLVSNEYRREVRGVRGCCRGDGAACCSCPPPHPHAPRPEAAVPTPRSACIRLKWRGERAAAMTASGVSAAGPAGAAAGCRGAAQPQQRSGGGPASSPACACCSCALPQLPSCLPPGCRHNQAARGRHGEPARAVRSHLIAGMGVQAPPERPTPAISLGPHAAAPPPRFCRWGGAAPSAEWPPPPLALACLQARLSPVPSAARALPSILDASSPCTSCTHAAQRRLYITVLLCPRICVRIIAAGRQCTCGDYKSSQHHGSSGQAGKRTGTGFGSPARLPPACGGR